MSNTSYAPVTYTLKAGKGFDDSWCVLHGTPEDIRHKALELFGLDADSFEGQSTYDVLRAIEEIMQGERVVMQTLGGRAIKGEGEAAKHDPWTRDPDPKDAEKPNPNAGLIEGIQSAGSEEALKQIWAKNKDAFSDEGVKAAYIERRDELKKAA